MSKLFTLALTTAFCAAGAAQAVTVNLNLGVSAETYTLYGQGDNGAGRGTYTNGQGSSTFDGITSTFTLTGAIDSASDARFANGTYTFITWYDGLDSPEGGPNAPRSISNIMNPGFFNYSALDSSTVMTLFLETTTGDYTIPLFGGGMFQNGFSFLFDSATCSGVAVAPCNQLNVGLTDGAIYSGQTFIFASFDDGDIIPDPTPTPAPAPLALFSLGLAALAAGRFRRRA